MTANLGLRLRNLRLRALAASTPVRTLRRRLTAGGPDANVYDVAFVTPPASAPGWILEAICREIAARLPAHRTTLCNFGTPLPAARRYFFSHYMYYFGSLSLRSPIARGRSYVFATHLEGDKHGMGSGLVARLLDSADGVICMNSALREELARLGVSRRKLSVVVGAASAQDYPGHERTADGKVGFSSAFYARKSPELMLEIVRGMPHRRFVLLGRGWRAYERYAELASLGNFEYVEAPYSDYPSYYAGMSVFVSASQLEGGPIPLLEAMMSNVVPVASRTGFAPDVIEHGRNGFLFDIGAPAQEVRQLIEHAFELRSDVRASVRNFDWDHFAANVARELGCAGPT